MGHGDHWRCIFPYLENGIAHALGWVSRGPVVGQREHPNLRLPDGSVGATVSVVAWPATGLRASFTQLNEASCGLEARISGVLGDAAVTFFDPLYCLNHNRYRPGAILDVELAGIAYSLSIVPSGTTVQSV